MEQLEAELSARSAEYRQAKQAIPLEDLQGALSKNIVLVDFIDYSYRRRDDKRSFSAAVEHRLLAFVVHPDRPVEMVPLGEMRPINEAIETWLVTFGMSAEGAGAARRLRELLWAPLEKKLHGAKIVLISPDGALSRLPFGVLPGKRPGTYLVEELTFAVVPVPQLIPQLVREEGRKQLRKKLLLLGNVDYDAPPAKADVRSPGFSRNPVGEPPKVDGTTNRTFATANSVSYRSLRPGPLHFDPLPGTESEIAAIEELYHHEVGSEGVTALRKSQADKEAFLAAAHQYGYLHLATHGFFIEERVPGWSFLRKPLVAAKEAAILGSPRDVATVADVGPEAARLWESRGGANVAWKVLSGYSIPGVAQKLLRVEGRLKNPVDREPSHDWFASAWKSVPSGLIPQDADGIRVTCGSLTSGQWYAANDWCVFRSVEAYVDVTGDKAFLGQTVAGKTVREHMVSIATAYTKLKRKAGLASYGENDNLLECAPEYIHCVASFNAANVHMLRRSAEYLDAADEKARAADLRDQAAKIQAAVLGLYSPGEGTWNTMHLDGRRFLSRHCYDYIVVGQAMENELTAKMKKEMTAFVDNELRTKTWMRAMSLKDPAATKSDRPDHGPLGSYDGWPPLVMDVMCRFGAFDRAVDFLRSTEEVTHEGSFAQGHEFLGPNQRGYDPIVRIASRCWHDANCICGAAFMEVIIGSFFGYRPDLPGESLQLLAPDTPRGFTGELRHVPYHGEHYTLVSGADGIRKVVERSQ